VQIERGELDVRIRRDVAREKRLGDLGLAPEPLQRLAHPGERAPALAHQIGALGHRGRQRLLEVAEQTLAVIDPGGLQEVERDLEVGAPRERHELCDGRAGDALERLEERLAPEARGVHEGAVDVPEHEARHAR